MDIQPLRGNAWVLAAAMAGTAVEFYDFFIYATAAALVFGSIFFPSYSHAAQTLLSFATFGVAFVARPIGALAFGHFGDRMGRKSTLVASLLLMGGSTLGIAFLPTYAMVGWIAPALLCLLRFGQGFGLGGEWGGAALLAVENAPRGWEARFGAAPQLGVPIGFLAANALFMLLSFGLTDAEFLDWGWRVPFLASAILVGLGLWVRLKIGETPQFRAALERGPPLQIPLARLVTRHWRAVLAGAAGVIATFATFYLATAYALSLATGSLGYQRESFLAVQLGANLFYALGILLAAIYADRTSPGRLIALGALGTAVAGLFFGPGIGTGSLIVAGITLAAVMFALGITNAPLGCWLARLFPVGVRYSGVALAFNAGGIVGGALTPFVAQLLNANGWGAYTGLLLTVGGILTIIGVRSANPEY